MGKPWLKLWVELRRDAKLTRVEPAWRWVWVGLLTLAQETDDGGRILDVEGQPMRDAEIAQECSVPLDTWLAARAYFMRVRTSAGLSMLSVVDGAVCVTNHAKRQAPDATHAARQARYREKSASRDASRDASKRDETDRRQTDRGQKTEDRGQKKEDRTGAPRTPPPPVNGNGAHNDDTAAVSGGGGAVEFDAISQPEMYVAANYVRLTAPDFRGLASFITAINCKLVGYCALHVGEAIAAGQEIANPAGLIRTLVQTGTYPDVPGRLRDRWIADVQAARNGEYAEDTNVNF